MRLLLVEDGLAIQQFLQRALVEADLPIQPPMPKPESCAEPRLRNNEPLRLQAADLQLDLVRREAWRRQKLLQLTSQEFSLLEYLCRNQGRRLRGKVDHDASRPLIQTISGVEYILRDRLRICAIPQPGAYQFGPLWPLPLGQHWHSLLFTFWWTKVPRNAMTLGLAAKFRFLRRFLMQGGWQKNLPSPSQVISHDTVIRRK